MQVYSCEPELELTGATVLSLLINVNQDQVQPFLDAHNLTEIDPDEWYPLQDVLNVMNDIARSGDTTGNFVAIGVKAAEISPLPPELAAMPFDQFMRVYANVYQQRHRNGNPGELIIEDLGMYHIAIHFDVPYPDDVMYGLIFGFARRLFGTDMSYTVYYDEDVVPRDHGGGETIIHVVWEY